MKRRYAVDDEERRTVAMSFRVKPTHHKILVDLCKEEDRSMTSHVERALVMYFKSKKVL